MDVCVCTHACVHIHTYTYEHVNSQLCSLLQGCLKEKNLEDLEKFWRRM